MWTALLTLFKVVGVGLPSIVSDITKQITEERTKQLASKNESERIASNERIRDLEIQRDVIIQSQKERVGEWVRLAWALPFIIYIWKLLLWDKVMDWGATDPLSPTLEYILWTVLGGYFLLAMKK